MSWLIEPFDFEMVISTTVTVLKTRTGADKIPGHQKKRKNRSQSVILVDVALERRTMTTIPEISARGSLIL